MKDMRLVRANEKLKRASTLLGNGGLGLLIAGISRWYGTGVDLTAAIWIVAAAATIWVGVQINDLLQPEDEG